MAYGLRVRDHAGAISVEYSDRISRVLGSFSTGTSNGSFVVPSDASGAVFYAVAGTTGFAAGIVYPTVYLSGRTISWAFETGSASDRRAATIVYGVHS